MYHDWPRDHCTAQKLLTFKDNSFTDDVPCCFICAVNAGDNMVTTGGTTQLQGIGSYDNNSNTVTTLSSYSCQIQST